VEVVVIGGGVGGLATAGLLARGGATVTLIEAQDSLGGRAGRLSIDGYTFDTGPSWYLMPEAFEQYFHSMGRDIHDYLDLQRLDPRYRVFFEQDDTADVLDVRDDAQANWDAFEQMSPGAGAAMKKYAHNSRRLYRLALDAFLYTTFKNPLRSMTRKALRRLPSLASYLTSSLHRITSRAVSDQRLQQLLGFHAVFLGSSPKRAPALYSLMSHLDLIEGVRYPAGGFYSVIAALEQVAREEGVTIRTGTPVTKILVDQDRGVTTGVMLEGGETLNADLVVSGADMHHTETVLLEAPFRTHPETSWKGRSPGVSALLVMAGFPEKIPELDHHNLFFTRDWEANFNKIVGDGTLEPPIPASIYVSKVTQTEPSAAPEGCENLVMLVPFPADPEIGRTVDSRAHMEDIARQYWDQVGSWAGISRLGERVDIKAILTPSYFADQLHAWKGSALGLEHTLGQSALFRPSNVSGKVANLLYVGSSTVPGIGVPICLISAELVVKRLLGDTSAAATAQPFAPGFLTDAHAAGRLSVPVTQRNHSGSRKTP